MVKQVALYKLPEVLETARILDDSVLDAYNDSIQSFDKIARQTLNRFGKRNRDLISSNPFMLVHLANSGLLPAGSRLARRKELETAVSFDSSFLTGNYTDFGLALRSAGDSYAPNNLLAKKLAEQLKQRGIELGKGKLIPLTFLKLKQSNSEYGLLFELNEQTTKEEIRDLNEFKWDYKRDNGVARAYLGRSRYWVSGDVFLENSSDYGRVVLVSAEALRNNPK